MATPHSILFRSQGSLDSFAAEVSNALAVSFKPGGYDPDGYWGVASDFGVGAREVSFGTEFEEDEGDEMLRLSTYQFSVDISADEDEAAHARVVFEQLKTLGKRMILLENLEIELERFEPPAA